MKNIFGFEKYAEGKSSQFDGARFISCSSDVKPEVKEKKLPPIIPLYLTLLQYAGLILVCAMVFAYIRANIPFKYIFEEAIYIPLLFIAGTIIYFAIGIYESQKRKKMIKNGELDDEYEMPEEDEEAENDLEERAKQSLGIPEDAIDMDVLGTIYRTTENGAENVGSFDFITMEMFVFADNEQLHVADYSNVYSFDIGSLGKIERIDSQVTSLGWSKDDEVSAPQYAELNMSLNEQGVLTLPYYYSVRVSAEDEEFELAIPPYELSAFSQLLKKES